MPFEDPWLRDGKMSPLDWERRLYEQTGNAIHAWRAYQICSELMRGGIYKCDSLPDWLLDYFDACASAVQELFHQSAEGPASAIPAKLADGLGFKRAGQGVRDTAFSNYDIAERDRWIAGQIRRETGLRPNASKESIVAEIAERNNVSIEVAWRACRTWNEF